MFEVLKVLGDKLKVESNDNLYVYEKSLEGAEDTLNSLRKSIANERNKSGVLIGFSFLFLVQIFPYVESLSDFLKGILFVLILVLFRFLFKTFSSKKMADGINVSKNFKQDRIGTRGKFLKNYYEVIKANINDQKVELSQISKNNKYSIIVLIIIFLILFINQLIPMSNFFLKENPININNISHGYDGISCQCSSLSEDEENTMEPEYIEKTE